MQTGDTALNRLHQWAFHPDIGLPNIRSKLPENPFNIKIAGRNDLLISSCDMKLQSVLLGGAILTKPCVSPQVFHGSMRLTGSVWLAATARGVEPSRKCIKPGSLKPGES